MKTHSLATLCFLAVFFPACLGGQDSNKPMPQVDSRVRLVTDDGRTIEKPISLDDKSGVENLRHLVGKVSGRFVLTISTRRTNDKFDQEIEGRLENGMLNGPVDTYLVVGDKRQLLSKVTYSADVRQGTFVSYYPKTRQVQSRAHFDEGTKNGEFSSFYSNGSCAVRVHYDHDRLEGLCEVYDNSGALVASGTYVKGVPASGTFVEDLRSFIMESIDNRPIFVRIATLKAAGESTEIVERTLNPKK